MSNKTLQDLFALEAQLVNIKNTDGLHATISAHSEKELEEAATYTGRHLFSPFEQYGLNDHRYFDYHLESNPKIYTTVRGPDLFRKRTKIVPV